MLKKILHLNILSSFVKSSFFILCFIALQASSEVWQIDDVGNASLSKQEERIEKLKSRLANLERAKDEALSKYLLLKEKIFKEEVSLIEKKIKSYKRAEKKIKKDKSEWREFLQKDLSLLFLAERKMLTEMLHDFPSASSKEKIEGVLNNILNIITALNEQKALEKIN